MSAEVKSFGLDIDQSRAITPGCENRIHFNNAGSALPTQVTLDRVIEYLHREAAIGGYEAAREAAEELEAVYQSAATLINASPAEIALMESSTRAWDSIFYSLQFQTGDCILTGRSEYASNYIAMLQVAKRHGVRIEVIEDDEHGQVDLSLLADKLDDQVRLVALTWCPTNNGLINPAQEVGSLLQSHRAWYLLDACQAVGQMAVDVQALNCDFLTATGRKFLRAPRGTGFLYVRNNLCGEIEPSQIDMRAAYWSHMDSYELREDARRFETWEASHALRLGLKSAIDQLLDLGVQNVEQRIRYLSGILRDQLAGIDHIQLHDRGLNRSGIVTFSSSRLGTCRLESELMDAGINIGISPQKMARLDMEPRGLIALIRASVHFYNTESEIERFCAVLSAI